MAKTIPLTLSKQQAPRLAVGEILGAAARAPTSLYIHVPFCFHKCHYCDFYSFVDSRDRQQAFTDALGAELETLAGQVSKISPGLARPELRTIFVGGGTPSLLTPDRWRQVLKTLASCFDLSPIARGDGEFTVECNPETVTAELMATLREGGVDRVSVGAQSFDGRHLKTLERWHDPASVKRALDLAREAGIARRSLDLIFAIPGQSLDDWRHDLETAVSLDPELEHLSCYCLTYEQGTAMTTRLQRGEFEPSPEDLQAEMYMLARETLRAYGLERYEISNFARAVGRSSETRSQHNLVYWRDDAWLAAGPSGSAHIHAMTPEGVRAGHRYKNVPHLTEWMNEVNSTGASLIIDYEPPDARRGLADRIMMGMRLAEGIDEEELFADAARLGRETPLREAIARLQERGLIANTPDRVALADAGYLLADGVISDLIETITPSAH